MCLSEYFTSNIQAERHGSINPIVKNIQLHQRPAQTSRTHQSKVCSPDFWDQILLLIKSIIGYININCKKAFTVLYTIYDMPINVEQHFIEYCIYIGSILHEAWHHLNEIYLW